MTKIDAYNAGRESVLTKYAGEPTRTGTYATGFLPFGHVAYGAVKGGPGGRLGGAAGSFVGGNEGVFRTLRGQQKTAGLIQSLGKGASRWGELLKGTRAAQLETQASRFARRAKLPPMDMSGAMQVADGGAARSEFIPGGGPMRPAGQLVDHYNALQENVANERNKVLATRIGTGAGLMAAGNQLGQQE